MSTDLRDPASKPPGDGPAPEEKPKPALSITQVIGGALAAMTAAALGSRLSVAGTVVGAALASVVAAVAGAIYTSSLRRTTQTVSTVWRTRVRPDGQGGTETVVEEVTEDGTVVQPAVGPAADQPTTTIPAAAAPTWAGAGTTDDGSVRPSGGQSTLAAAPRRRIGWKPVVLAAVLMFAIAAVALTGLELATGRSLSGGTGTTVGQVAEGRTDPTPTPSPSATRKPSATPSATTSAEPSSTPSSTPSSEPTAEPTPTLSSAPTPSPTPVPSSTPSATPGSGASAPAATPTS